MQTTHTYKHTYICVHTLAVEKVKSEDEAEKERLRKEYEAKVKLLEAHGMCVCV
jgi:hypothetical protein